jgi:hypothetical protein
MGDDGSRHSSELVGDTEDQELLSPLKQQKGEGHNDKVKAGAGVSRHLDMQVE